MIYQTPDRWRLERRGPQHAAPLDSSAPFRRHSGRVLRLIVTAGAWGAGLCLVIGLVAMVAQSAGPSRRPHAGNADAVTSPTAAVTSPTAYDRYLKQFVGTGRAYRWFDVAGHSRWELRWSYRCSAGTRGSLTISEPTISAGVHVQSAGAAARGITWAFSDDTTHFLVIHGSCPWTVTVAGHR